MQPTRGERPHIGFFGRRNAGKSSLVNALSRQELSIVSHTPGTTTDLVQKSMEILPLGPVVLVDTPGLDDEGELGEKRVQVSEKALRTVDFAVLVVDERGIGELEEQLIQKWKEEKKPYLVVHNKMDKGGDLTEGVLCVSSLTGEGMDELLKALGEFRGRLTEKKILDGVIKEGDVVVLVIPIDASAPKERLILPQQMVLREVLDAHGLALCLQVEELEEAIRGRGLCPDLVITDSQVFGAVSKIVPEEIRLTSFSILMARYKGNLSLLLQGIEALDDPETKRILISEGCTHRRSCEDIGTVKIPQWIREYTGREDLEFLFSTGRDFPEEDVDFIIHCGGCMLTPKEMQERMKVSKKKAIPMTNYGMLIAHVDNILPRAMAVFQEI